jgi:hypothetical protein
MKILVFHQPFPMGNYRLNEILANKLQKNGHEVYLLQQLNGSPATQEYIDALKAENFDVIYYEMLDAETFKVVEQLSALRVLLVASRGIFTDFYTIMQYKGKYFDKVMTNSIELSSEFKKNGIECELFNFYFIALTDEERMSLSEKYKFDNVFLGMGFGRLTDPDYAIERSIFFDSEKSFNFGLFGNGWNGVANYKGLLLANDIGLLYSSALSANAIIGSGQRSMGMINNRYTEIAACSCPLISYPYNIDWFGADKFINFVTSADELNSLVLGIKQNNEMYQEKASEFNKFINNQDKVFFEKLENLFR